MVESRATLPPSGSANARRWLPDASTHARQDADVAAASRAAGIVVDELDMLDRIEGDCRRVENGDLLSAYLLHYDVHRSDCCLHGLDPDRLLLPAARRLDLI